MKANLQGRLGKKDDEGFTLIELMVVVLIIAILMAIAIPTFLSARGNAQAKAAEANIRNALTDEQTYFTNQGQGSGYGAASNTTFTAGDTALSFVSAFSSSNVPSNQIYIASGGTSTAPTVIVGDVGGNGNSYWAYDQNGSISYAIEKGADNPPTVTGTVTPTTGHASNHETAGTAPGTFYTSW